MLFRSGGAWEYVMANYNDIVASSGFANPLTLDSKYYDKYTSGDSSTACNGSECISHALSETSGWYNDYHNMVNEERSWILRSGAYYSSESDGVFRYNIYSGSQAGDESFRLVSTIR